MDQLLDTYHGSTSNITELELRYKLTEPTYKLLYMSMLDQSPINMLINKSIIIYIKAQSHLGTDQRIEKHYNDKSIDQAYQTIYTEKQSLIKDYVEMPGKPVATLALYKETTLEHLKPITDSKFKIRVRKQFEFNDYPGWQFQFTVVFDANTSNIKELKATVFNYAFDDLISKLNVATKHLHFEVEHIKPSKPEDILELKRQICLIHEYIRTLINTSDPAINNKPLYFGLLKSMYTQIFGKKTEAKISFVDLINKPKSFDLKGYNSIIYPNILTYYICEKNDGERALIYVQTFGNNNQIINKKYIIRSTGVEENESLFNQAFASDFILDVEIVANEIWVFDILIFESKSLVAQEFNIRLSYLDKFFINLIKKPSNIHKKAFKPIESTEVIKQYIDKSKDPKYDGLIFTPSVNSKYYEMQVWKWKSKPTIDFLLLKPPENLLGTQPYILKQDHTIYLLCVGISNSLYEKISLPKISGYVKMLAQAGLQQNLAYFPIVFNYENSGIYYDVDPNLNGHIAEFWYNNGFEKLRMRPDKDPLVKNGKQFGNDYVVALSTYEIMKHPISESDLLGTSGAAENYFKHKKKPEHRRVTQYNNYVKSRIMSAFIGMTNVLDLCAGQGSDLYNFNSLYIKKLTCVDSDSVALQELNDRYRKMISNIGKYMYRPAPNKNMNIETIQRDLTAEWNIDGQYQGISCNFAVHYILAKLTIGEFVNRVRKLLVNSGVLVLSFMDNIAVEAAVRSDPHREFGEFAIKKISNTRVAVKLPFTGNEYYEETLVNRLALAAELKKSFQIIEEGNFIQYDYNSSLFQALNITDQGFVALYYYMICYKNTTS
jgi:hypothetical protein